MTEVNGVGRRRTQLLDDLRNRRRYWELKEEAEDRKSLLIEHKEEVQIIFHLSKDLITILRIIIIIIIINDYY